MKMPASKYSLPLVIKPENGRNSTMDLKEWITVNNDYLEESLTNHGAFIVTINFYN